MKADHGPRRRGDWARKLGTSIWLVLVVLLQLVTAQAEAVDHHFAGETLEDALAELQRRGLVIVYSTALVRPDMVVALEPAASVPPEILEEILEPFGLTVRQGPGAQLVIVPRTRPSAAESPGSIRGRLIVSGDQPGPLSSVVVRVVGTDLETHASGDGRFVLDSMAPGVHVLETSSPAFLTHRVESVKVRPGRTTRIEIALAPRSVFVSQIVVTPSHFRILEQEPEVRQFLSRHQVDQMPHAADDLYRAVKRLPGAAGGDYSARFNIRGGDPEEVLVLLDGLELYEPFHLKDFQSLFSTVDAEAVGGVDFLTGGFPVEYGDRMSGVMDIAIATPTGPSTSSVALGTINSRALSEGLFHGGRGQWLVSARAWYPASVLKTVGATKEELQTEYYDLLAKIQHLIGGRSTLSLDLLLAADDIGFYSAEADEVEDAKARDRSQHLWLNLKTEWSPRIFSETVAAIGRITRSRLGRVDDETEGLLDIDDQRDFHFFGLKQDWTVELDRRHLLKLGFDVKHQEAAYSYSRLETSPDVPNAVSWKPAPKGPDEVHVELEPEGRSYAVYLAGRALLTERLVAELGMRWDRQFWVDDRQLSPRLNLLYSAGARTTLRAAWGRFSQSQRLNELQVSDGVTEFYPAQLTEHWLASLEHRFQNALSLRVEAYDKEYKRLNPHYENLFNPIELFPEARDDRVLVTPDEGRSRGLEVVVKQDLGGQLTWWLSYANARAEDEIGGEMVPRSWDQRHAASFGVNLALPRGFNVNLAGTFHTGWPTTGVSGELVGWQGEEPDVELHIGARNRERYPDYARLDLRASKGFSTGLGELTLILDVLNLTNRHNACCVDDFSFVVLPDDRVEVIPERGYWAPIFPSISLRWRF